jgi:tetratricopeptide (TPR) repeat protein
MSTGKPPSKPPAKPFLGDDDLLSELDAWDATFDALHTGPQVAPGAADTAAGHATGVEHVIAWPSADAARRGGTAAVGTASAVAGLGEVDELGEATALIPSLATARAPHDPPRAPRLDRPGSELDVGELDVGGLDVGEPRAPTASPLEADDESLDLGLSPHRAPTSTSVELAQLSDPLEADFSDLSGRPTPPAVERSLRRTLPPPLAFDDEPAEATRSDGVPTPRGGLVGRRRSPSDDDVYTSASRPNPLGATLASLEEDDDRVAPPPMPEPRRGPAIVRRSVPHPTVQPVARPDSDESQLTPPHGNQALFAEHTRIADSSELEERVQSSRPSATAIPVDDAYDDIEIGDQRDGGGGAVAAEDRVGTSTAIGVPVAPAADALSAGRRTAHVLRRTDTPTRPPPPTAALPRAAPVPERGPTPAARARAASEEDFSDVAAAVGADGDLEVVDLPPGSRAALRGRAISLGLDLDGDDGSQPAADIADDDDFASPELAGEFSGGFPTDFEEDDFGAPPARPAPLDAALDALGDLGDSGELPAPPRFTSVGDLSEGEDSAPLPTLAAPAPTFLDSVPPMPRPAAPGARARPISTRPPVARPDAWPEPAVPIPTLPGTGAPAAGRPPAITDLYPPRVKTPTSVPPLAGGPELRGVARAPAAVPGLAVPPILHRDEPELEPTLDLERVARDWPEQVAPLLSAALDEASAASLLVYERELASLEDGMDSPALRVEAGRLCERLADLERARVHYDAALLLDPRATPALRGLRRIARSAGDLVEATRLLDSEIAVAGALERRPLGHYRIDLLMASGEQDLARVAVGEILDTAPSDVRALLAHLELAFLDGRADEFGAALEQLAHAVTDDELRGAAQAARGALAAHQDDNAAAMAWFTAAAEADPGALAARLGAIRYAAAQADADAAARALIDLGRQLEVTDPTAAAGAALRALQWQAEPTSELATAAVALAVSAAPADPLVARVAAESAQAMAGRAPDGQAALASALAAWSDAALDPAERAHAAARAAELDPARGAELWARALEIDPDDDYAAAQLRTTHVAAEAIEASIEVDVAVARDVERDRARLRAAYGLIGLGKLDAAVALLTEGRARRPRALALAEALGEALAAAGQWTARAQLFAELAAEPGDQLDRDVAQLRSAIAWEEAVGAVSAAAEPSAADPGEVSTVVTAALEAWERVLAPGEPSPAAHAAAIVLAGRLGDRDALAECLQRAQAAERSPWAAASLAQRRARLYTDDPRHGEALLRDLQPPEDPRRTVALLMSAARMQDLGEAAAALEDRARALDERAAATEIAALRLRAAQLALDAGDAARATRLLGRVEQALPGLGVVPDLLAAARRRAGDRPTPLTHTRRLDAAPGASAADAFARVVRDADLAYAQGDGGAALALYQRALELRPGDPLAAVPLLRVATQLREPGPATSLALAQLREAEEAGDGPGRAVAYELISEIDAELRSDAESAQAALESAAAADPSRIDLLQRLARLYAVADETGELLRLRRAELAVVPRELTRDRAALQLDLAGLAAADHHTEPELAELYRGVIEIDPGARHALLHLESIVRRSGASAELAGLEERIAAYFDGDAKAQAAFWTRAGETLAELGEIDAAVQRFGRAEAALPGHVPALEGWRQAALKGQLWIDVAEAASRQAASTHDLRQRAALLHFAGVALMDKALVGDQAMSKLRRALEADPTHRDAFLRLRILLEEDARHDELALLLTRRLEVEPDGDARVEMHRALAKLHRDFLSDRDTAKVHYRAVLDRAPNDLEAHAAIADIAWEQGSWQEAADALMARARLERDATTLRTLCFRLGLIYADRLVDAPMALKAFQRALTYQPDDEATLIRLADLATQVGEYKLALGACERLVKNEADPDRRVAHLHRVARIFRHGFGDQKRAERALNLALDGAPTSDDALQELVQFYRDARDQTSMRVHLNRVAGAMRARAQQAPLNGEPYRVIARTMAARATTGLAGSAPIARAAAQLADLLGAAGEPEQKLLAESAIPDLSLLTKPDADDVLFPRGVQVELRQIFQLLGDRIAKHVGVDLRPYGATRGDRLRARDNPVAAVAQSVASALGFGEIDVYVSSRQPWVMLVEPTSPVSLILGSAIAAAGGDAIRFAAGGALKLAQASLAIPARLAPDDLGVLVVALMRLFQPDFPAQDVDADGVATQLQKLRRLIPTSLLNELRPFALAIDPQRFAHRELARDLKITGLRAGLVASGSLLVGLQILAGQAQAELPGHLTDPVAQGLVTFALGEDHAVVAR